MSVNTSQEAIRLLEQAAATTRQAQQVIQNLVVEHDYQDVAALVAKAAGEFLTTTVRLLQSQPDSAFDLLEQAEETLDGVYAIIDAETDEDDED